MKKIAVLVLLGLFVMPMVAMAGDIDFWNEAGDIFTGHKDNVEFWPYIAYTTKETVKIGAIPIMPKGLRTEFSTHLGVEDGDQEYMLRVGLEL